MSIEIREIEKFQKRIKNLEEWNKEMYENHKIKVAGLETKVGKLETVNSILSAQLQHVEDYLEDKSDEPA